MTKIYVIIRDEGEYSDRDVQVVKAVSSEKRAQELVISLDKECRKDFVITNLLRKYGENYMRTKSVPQLSDTLRYKQWTEEFLNAQSEYKDSIDRDSLDTPDDLYYDTSYYYQELELED